MDSKEICIRITHIPQGPAPEKVRISWVGIELPAERLPEAAEEVDFITNLSIGNRGGFRVKVRDALEVLRRQSPEAVRWFEKNLPPAMPFLTFAPEEVVILPEDQ